jgi:protein CpxP
LSKEFQMTPIPRKTTRILAIAAASLAMTLGTAHAAQDSAPPGQPDAHGGGWHGGFMKDMEQLHKDLKLTPDQEVQWQGAIDTMKKNRAAARANHEAMRKQLDALRQQPILDLNALHAAHQRVEQQNAQLHEATTAAWLNLYNGMNDQQKAMVSAMLKQHFAKMEERHEKMRERWQEWRGAASGAMPESP